MKNILTVTGLSKTYPPKKRGGQPFAAIKNISFSLQEGEILGLLGPNGAGKSTTIQMLMGTLTPTNGSIQVFGKEFANHRSEILESIAFASTYIKMPWRLTVIENLLVYGLLYALDVKTFEMRAEKFLKYFEVWDQRDKTMNELSAGQVTRVMLAKAFIPHPKIALLDEPTASLDPDIAHQVRQFVKEQRSEYGVSILFTSHNMDEVAEVCDRVMFLKKGGIVAVDTPDNLAGSISLARMRLQVKDGLKRIKKFSKANGWVTTTQGREIVIELDEYEVAGFLARLADESIEYTQISIDKPTLEDYFLSLSDSDKV